MKMDAMKTDAKSDKTLPYARLTSEVMGYTTEFFRNRRFEQLMPVILSPITDPLGPDPGSSVIKTGEVEYYGQRLCLTQSMILHKQLALKRGLGRIFILSPNVRLEHERRAGSGRHLFEFSQADFEIAGAGMEEVFALMEEYMGGLTAHMRSACAVELAGLGRKLPAFSGPFPRYTTAELAEKYSSDWELPASQAASTPFWALSHKREFYDAEDPDRPGHYFNYDLIYPEGFGEALSGARREHEYERILMRIGRDGLESGRYAAYLELAKEGLVPSAGGGFGIERLVRYIAGAPHVADVQLFPRIPGRKVVA